MAEKQREKVIRPKSGWFNLPIKELVHYKDLILLFVKRDFVSLYKQTILGPAWAVIQPFVTTVIFSFFFGNIAGLAKDSGVPNFIFYLSGTVMWTYFANCLTTTSNTFISNSAILGKVYFPRLVMPVSTVISKLIDFVIQYTFMICFVVYYAVTGQIHPNWYILLTPLLLAQLAMLSLGFGIIISACTTKYRDLRMIVTFGVSLWMYATPIAYDMKTMGVFAIGGKFHTLYMCNPVTPIINVFRYAYLGIGQIEWLYYIISWIVTLIVLFFGIMLFSRVEKTFMDTV